MPELKYFGTDGVRGEVGQFPIIPDFVRALGYACGQVLAQHGSKQVVLGHDGRSSHVILADALIAGLNEADVTVRYCGLCPTPGIAYLTKHFAAEAGIVISASHNPAKDNGIKFFNRRGGKLCKDEEAAIEAACDNYRRSVAEIVKPLVTHQELESLALYEQFCLQNKPAGLDLQDWCIVVDGANGAMSEVAPHVLKALGATVECVFCHPNGENINQACGATDISALRYAVKASNAHLGLAFDGDGDRLLIVTAKGELIDGDRMLYLIARHHLQGNHREPGVVGTVMSNMGLELALKKLDIPFIRTAVGDAHVIAACRERGWRLGGEPNGHVICMDKAQTGDGLIAALEVLAALGDDPYAIDDHVKCYVTLPQLLVNVTVANPKSLMHHPKLISAIDAVNQSLGDTGRLLVRPSGTEPLIRIMLESQDASQNQMLADQIAAVVREIAVSDVRE